VSSLSLNDCGFGIEGMSLVAQSIVERKPGTLRSFYAARNMSPGFFTSAGTIHGAQTALSRLVKSSEPLVEMDLSGDSSNRFGEVRQCEERSNELTTQSFATKTAHARIFL